MGGWAGGCGDPVCYSVNGKRLWETETRVPIYCMTLSADNRYLVVGGTAKVGGNAADVGWGALGAWGHMAAGPDLNLFHPRFHPGCTLVSPRFSPRL